MLGAIITCTGADGPSAFVGYCVTVVEDSVTLGMKSVLQLMDQYINGCFIIILYIL